MTGHEHRSALRALAGLLPELDEVLVTQPGSPAGDLALADSGLVPPGRDIRGPNPRPHAA